MSRLPAELQRLYLPAPGDETDGSIDPQASVRALILEVARPADWSLLSTVWQGVQADLSLPAPGIAVSGSDGLQLWFSLAEPVSVARGHAFLDALRRRYLAEVPPARLRLWPAASDQPSAPRLQMPQVPALQPATGNWSAFIAQDLAPLFTETPWLDVPPGDEAQVSLLARLSSIDRRAFEAAWTALQPPPVPMEGQGMAGPAQAGDPAASSAPRRFLLTVMNDPAVPLALRIEAAKALLPYSERT